MSDDSPDISDACLVIGQRVGDVGAERGPTTQLSQFSSEVTTHIS